MGRAYAKREREKEEEHSRRTGPPSPLSSARPLSRPLFLSLFLIADRTHTHTHTHTHLDYTASTHKGKKTHAKKGERLALPSRSHLAPSLLSISLHTTTNATLCWWCGCRVVGSSSMAAPPAPAAPDSGPFTPITRTCRPVEANHSHSAFTSCSL